VAPPPGAPPVATAPLTAAPPPGAEGATRVAVLLPLSGPSGALGRAMLEAAQMALFDMGGDQLTLLPGDSGGTPQAAAAAAQAAITGGARLIIGPLLAAEVEAVKPIARAANVSVLAFSTATQLAGDGTYLMGFLPRQEIERVTAFAHTRGLNRFAVLAPQSPYGEIAVDTLHKVTAAVGASFVRADYYTPGTTALMPAVRRFAQTSGDFDALLLPEGGATLKALAPLLPYYNVDPDKVKFLGTGLWDDPSLGTEPSLDGGWYAAPPPKARADFEKRFQELYGHKAPRLATLGYDATALAAVLARNPSGPDFSAQALTNPNGFAGLDGIFRLRPDGLVQRGLAVLEVHRGAPTVIDPAPQTFEHLAY
jgi:ABC-type branched-subunit amino acid transport system substrate-binding protein